MCNKSRLAVLGLSAALCLSACGNTQESDRGQADTTEETQVTTETEPTAEETLPETDAEAQTTENPTAGIFAEAFAAGKVENNGGYFVRVGDKVYYRLYHERALQRTALFGGFLGSDLPDRPSKLMSYDLQTGAKEEVATVYGSGKLFACRDGLLLAYPDQDETYVIPMDGSEQTVYCKGTPDGVSEDGRVLIVTQYNTEYTGEGLFSWKAVICDGKEVARVEDENSLLLCGFAGNDAIFANRMEADDEDAISNEWRILSVDAAGTQTELGKLEPEEGFYDASPDARQIVSDEEGVYGTIGFYAGTGHFLQDWVAFSAKPGVAGSLEMLEPENREEFSGMENPPSMLLTGPGEVEFFKAPVGQVAYSEGGYGDLVYYDSPYSAVVLKEDYFTQDEATGEWPWGNFLLDAVVFDDTAFLITAYGTRNELYDIGWRYAYDLVYLEYSCIPFDADHLENGVPKETVSLEFLTSTGWADACVDLSNLTGSWKLESYENEGYSGNAEADGLETRLVIAEDGSAYLEEKVDGRMQKEELTRQAGEEADVYVYCTNDGEGDDVMQLDIIGCNEYYLETSISWWYSDGVPGGSSWVFVKE